MVRSFDHVGQPLRLSGQPKRLSYVALILLLASGASAEHPVAPEAVIGPAPIGESYLRAGTDGDSYLVTWVDQRGVRGARYDGDGTLLDPVSLQLAPPPAELRNQYLTAAQSMAGARGQWVIAQANGSLFQLRPDGVTQPIELTMKNPAVASNGRGFLIYSTSTPDAATYAAGVSRRVAPAALPSFIRSVAAHEAHYCVLGRDGNRLLVNFVHTDGGTLYPAPRVLLDTDSSGTYKLVDARVVRDGDSFVAVWLSATPGKQIDLTYGSGLETSWRVQTARFGAPASIVRGRTTLQAGTSRDNSWATFKSIDVVQLGPGDALVRWIVPEHGMLATRLSCAPAAPFKDDAAMLVSNGTTILRAANELLTARAWKSQVRVAVPGCDLSALASAPATVPNRSAPEQSFPRLAAGQETLAMAWNEAAGVEPVRAHAALLSLGGKLLQKLKLPGPEQAGDQLRVGGIASDGRDFMVVWTEGTNVNNGSIRAMRLVPERSPEVPLPVTVATLAVQKWWGSSPRIVWNGSLYLIVWAAANEVRLARMTRDGVVLDPEGQSLTRDLGYASPDSVELATSGSDSLVVWHYTDLRCPIMPVGCWESLGVRGLRLNRDGRPLWSIPRVLSREYGSHAQVAWRAPYWYVAWTDMDYPYYGRGGRYIRRLGDGKILDGEEGHRLGAGGYVSALVPAAHGVGVVMSDASVTVLGGELEPLRTVAAPPAAAHPDAALIAPEKFLLVYQRQVAESPYAGVYRVFANAVDTR